LPVKIANSRFILVSLFLNSVNLLLYRRNRLPYVFLSRTTSADQGDGQRDSEDNRCFPSNHKVSSKIREQLGSQLR
jgi:hypothetical protein